MSVFCKWVFSRAVVHIFIYISLCVFWANQSEQDEQVCVHRLWWPFLVSWVRPHTHSGDSGTFCLSHQTKRTTSRLLVSFYYHTFISIILIFFYFLFIFFFKFLYINILCVRVCVCFSDAVSLLTNHVSSCMVTCGSVGVQRDVDSSPEGRL